ncbi:MAG: TrkA family potassium uptake protein [Gemmatimonadaceae bacterium]|nr:TrkA family potassium uptake protein [Gemmatimonadaceae bacterium]
MTLFARTNVTTIRGRATLAVGALLGVYCIGVIGYKVIGGAGHSWLDALYMTTITLTTTGYREVIDITTNPVGQLFTIGLLLFGATVVVTTGSILTAAIVEGDLTKGFRRTMMQRKIDAMTGHTIVCGAGQTGGAVVRELAQTGNDCVAIEASAERAEEFSAEFPNVPVLVGDCSDDEMLVQAGIQRAAGVVICTDDDKNSLVTTVLSRQLNKSARIIVRTSDDRQAQRLRGAGADGVVAPAQIGGMRLASELIRPSVVTFLDQMLRDTNRNLRLEEVRIEEGSPIAGRTVESLHLHDYATGVLLLAVRELTGEYVFNPPARHGLPAGIYLIVMGTPENVAKLRKMGARTNSGAFAAG